MTDNSSYYQQRIEEELAAAASAGDMAISRIHRDMARRYRDRLNGATSSVKGSNGEPGTVFG